MELNIGRKALFRSSDTTTPMVVKGTHLGARRRSCDSHEVRRRVLKEAQTSRKRHATVRKAERCATLSILITTVGSKIRINNKPFRR